jgi:hypothetical protein
MWPFDTLRRHRFQRRYHAALLVYLAAYTYPRLSPADQQRIDREIEQYYERNTGFSAYEFKTFLSVSFKAAFWAVVMNELSIPPAVAGEQWTLPKKRWWSDRLAAAHQLVANFRPYNPITNAARERLASKGVNVEALEQYLTTAVARPPLPTKQA